MSEEGCILWCLLLEGLLPGRLRTRDRVSTHTVYVYQARVPCPMKVAMLPFYLEPPYLQNLSPAKIYVFLFLLQLKAASTRWTSGGNPRLVSGLGYPRSRVLAE